MMESLLLSFVYPSVASDNVLPVQLRWTNVHRAMHSLRRNPPQVGILTKTAAPINNHIGETSYCPSVLLKIPRYLCQHSDSGWTTPQAVQGVANAVWQSCTGKGVVQTGRDRQRVAKNCIIRLTALQCYTQWNSPTQWNKPYAVEQLTTILPPF